jgi:hypothetical protein
MGVAISKEMINKECSQCVFQMLVNLHNGGLVAAAVTVIWCCNPVQWLDSGGTCPSIGDGRI